MRKVRLICFIFLAFSILAVNAQKQSDNFLKEMYSIDNFHINSNLKDILDNKSLSENLSFVARMDNRVSYYLTGRSINLPGLKVLDRLAFDTIELTFYDNKLHDIILAVPLRFYKETFTNTCQQFNVKYGTAKVTNQKNKTDKQYTWNLGDSEIVIAPYSGGFIMCYESKTSTKPTGWLYNKRKGKGSGTFQLTLPYLEKQLNSNLSITSFENKLPSWETTGQFNFVFYTINFKTRALDQPTFNITYSLSNYDIQIITKDTVSKIINDYVILNIKDNKIWASFEKSLADLNYQISPANKYSRQGTSMFTNRIKQTVVSLDKVHSRISLSKTFYPLP